jgi:uncharacterized protein (TIGR00106 family)
MSSMIAAFSITPLGTGESVGELVAETVRIVRASGLPNETNAMFTNIEGEWDEVMAVIKECVDTMAQAAPRVSVVVKLDHRPGQTERPYESKGGVCRAPAVRELRSCWVTGDAWDREGNRRYFRSGHQLNASTIERGSTVVP